MDGWMHGEGVDDAGSGDGDAELIPREAGVGKLEGPHVFITEKKGAGEDDGVGLRLSLWTLWADASILADGLLFARELATNMQGEEPRPARVMS